MGRDVKALLFWMIICLYFVIESLRLGLGRFNAPGAGFLPFWVAIILGVLTLIELVRRLSNKREDREAPVVFLRDRTQRMLCVLIIIFTYPFFMDKLGFFLCTLLFSGACLRTIAGKRWVVVIGLSSMLTLLAYVIFEVWLQILFPEGRWVTTLFSMGRDIFHGNS